jgi:hypothetical protein
VILTQIRCTASFLNHDLHKVHILSNPACSCGAPLKKMRTTSFFVCTKYSEISNDLFLSISDLSQLINTSLLTSGSETLNYADNCFIFDSVFRLIERSKRFLIVYCTNQTPSSIQTHTHTHTYFFFISVYSFTIFSYII